jgi:hypothetical protein
VASKSSGEKRRSTPAECDYWLWWGYVLAALGGVCSVYAALFAVGWAPDLLARFHEDQHSQASLGWVVAGQMGVIAVAGVWLTRIRLKIDAHRILVRGLVWQQELLWDDVREILVVLRQSAHFQTVAGTFTLEFFFDPRRIRLVIEEHARERQIPVNHERRGFLGRRRPERGIRTAQGIRNRRGLRIPDFSKGLFGMRDSDAHAEVQDRVHAGLARDGSPIWAYVAASGVSGGAVGGLVGFAWSALAGNGATWPPGFEQVLLALLSSFAGAAIGLQMRARQGLLIRGDVLAAMGRCRHCGFDLRAVGMDRCPECGLPRGAGSSLDQTSD